jgi:hypothetical protein
MRLITIAVLSAACLSVPTLAADADKPAPKPVKEKRICRESMPTGSRLTVRTCHS